MASDTSTHAFPDQECSCAAIFLARFDKHFAMNGNELGQLIRSLSTFAHVVRHVHVVVSGTMVALLVGDHEFAPLRGIPWPAGGTSRVIYRYAVLKQRDLLQRERDFNAQLVR